MTILLRKLKTRPQKILISRTDRIGDFILTLPVFEALGQQFSANFTILCQDTVVPILEHNPFVQNIISVKSTDSTKNICTKIIKENFDAIIVMVNDPFILKILPHLKSIPVRIGPLSKLKAFSLYTHPVIQKRSKSILNEAEYNLELLKIFDQKVNVQIKPKVYVENSEKDQLKRRLNYIQFEKRKTIIYHTGMSGSALNWDDQNYEILLTKLAKLDVNIVLTGYSESEKKRNIYLIEQLPNKKNIFDLTGQVILRELIVLHALSDIFVGPSTGPTHIANAAGLKIFSFYPPIKVQSKTRWQPYLANAKIFSPNVSCGQKYKCIENKCLDYDCMKLISVTEVFNAVQSEVLKAP